MKEYQSKELKTLLDKRGWTLAIAESLTAGMLQSDAASISGSSSYFLGGITTYTIDAKVKFLEVDGDHARSVNAVSEQVVTEMADGIKKAFGADVGIATTGFAEPSEALGVVIPHAFICVNLGDNRVFVNRVEGMNLNRNEMRRHVANETINLLLKVIKSLL